jgi:integrase
VFPVQLLKGARRSDKRPLSENTTNKALRRLGFGSESMTSHGFRAVFATLTNESGRWSADAIERQLAHVEANSVRRAYSRGAHWDERVNMMQWWADYLDMLRQGGRVVPFKAASA